MHRAGVTLLLTAALAAALAGCTSATQSTQASSAPVPLDADTAVQRLSDAGVPCLRAQVTALEGGADELRCMVDAAGEKSYFIFILTQQSPQPCGPLSSSSESGATREVEQFAFGTNWFAQPEIASAADTVTAKMIADALGGQTGAGEDAVAFARTWVCPSGTASS